MTRDITAAQFEKAIREEGMTPRGFLGYVQMPCKRCLVSSWNGGEKRRSRLAYLLRQRPNHVAGRDGETRCEQELREWRAKREAAS